MTKGQQRRLTKEVNVMEEEDMAMWSTLRGQRIPMPRGWKAMMEVFAGCAVLTSVFQAAGYSCCAPLDILGGWDVHRQADRAMAEKVFFTENPYLLTWAFPCGPWSPWQRLQPEEKTNAKRRQWIPVFSWMYRTIRKHKARGGRTLLENPWLSEAWNTAEIQMVLKLGLEIVRIDMCRFGLKDKENGLAHRKMTCIATDSEEILGVLRGMTCRGDHQHQPLEGRNCYGPRCAQAARYTVEFCQRILRGFQKDLEAQMCHSFCAEESLEDRDERDLEELLDGVYESEDLGQRPQDVSVVVEKEEDLELLDKEADPEAEKMRKREWRRLSKAERTGIRRLHHMTSHSTRSQMTRMLRYANADHRVIRGVKHFRCPACDRIEPEKRPQVVRNPDPYRFNDSIGLDVITIKDSADQSYQILHVLCLGTCYHVGEVLGASSGVPSSKKCLEVVLRSWISWAGFPNYILVDRGTHNRGVFMTELERKGCKFRLVALEAPHQLGKVERAGGVLKDMLKRVINAESVRGELEMQMTLCECLETKNRQGTIGGFSPSQWVIGRNPRRYGWPDDAEEEDSFIDITDRDPTSTFNRSAGFREAAKLAWAMADSHRRVRSALLRKGGAAEETFKPGDI